jgi:hypothetical protein
VYIYFAGSLIHSKVKASAYHEGQSGDYGPVGVGAARWGECGAQATYYPFGEKRPESNSHWNLDVSNQTASATYQRDANGSGARWITR